MSSATDLVHQTNPITPELHAFRESITDRVQLDDPRIATIIRLRLLGEAGYPGLDVSYCWGVLKDGTRVDVIMPESRLPLNWKRFMVQWGRDNKVYVAGTGLFDADVVSILR